MLTDISAAQGLRRSTPSARRATALADGYAGLGEGLTRWRLAAALRAAARPLGLSGAMLRLLEHYIDLTYDQDWAEGSEPVVTRPLVEIAEHLGRSERQVRNVERALVEKGLLAWRDSGNHHRKGRRDRTTGRLVYAYGPSLAPLGARAAEILARAAAARAEIAEARRLRIAVSALRRRIRADLAAAEASGIAVDAVAGAFADIPERCSAGMSADALRGRRDALAALAAALLDALGGLSPAQDTSDLSGEPETFGRHMTDTSKNHAMNGVSIALKQAKQPAEAAGEAERRPDHGLSAIPLALATAAAGPELSAALGRRGEPSWPALVDAAREIAPLLGVETDLWGEACGRLGRYGAALAVLLIERGACRGPTDPVAPIRRPSAYLRGMIAKAEDGRLNLDRSLRAWAERSVMARV